MHITRGILLTAASLWLGCASQVHKVQEIQSTLSELTLKSEPTLQKVQADHREKNELFANLKKTNSKDFRASEEELRKQMERLASFFQEIQKQAQRRKVILSEISALAQAHPTARSGSAEFKRVDEQLTTFDEAGKMLNLAMVDYSLTSNNLADDIKKKNLFFNYDLAALQKRIQISWNASQKNLGTIQQDLERNETLLNPLSADAKAPAISKYNEVVYAATEYEASAQKLLELSKEIQTLSKGVSRLSSLNELWPQLQPLIAEAESRAQALPEGFVAFGLKSRMFKEFAKTLSAPKTESPETPAGGP